MGCQACLALVVSEAEPLGFELKIDITRLELREYVSDSQETKLPFPSATTLNLGHSWATD